MSDTQILNELIKDSAKIPLEMLYGKFQVTLQEPNCPESQVIIKGLPEDALVIKSDCFTAPDRIFRGSKGECKRADFVIVSELRRCIVFIEMKKTTASKTDIINQLAGARCFFIYSKEIGTFFWKKRAFLQEYQERYISIVHTSPNKGKTSFQKNIIIHNTPENPLRISKMIHLQFNHIACLNS